ncbi:MAG: peptidylprolyl isomerase [Planctomycetota bacterium]
MRYIVALFILTVALIGAASADTAKLPSESEGARIVARVNESFITLRDVARRAMILGSDNAKALQSLIEDRVVSLQAAKEGIKVTDDEVQKSIKDRLEHFTTMEEFTKNVLGPLGMTMENYSRDMKEQLMREKYFQRKVGAHRLEGKNPSDFVIDTYVSPREIKEFFEKNRLKFEQPAKIKTRQIILKFADSEERLKKKALADEILERLKKGDDFAELAKQCSDIKAESGGDWDWTPKGTFPEEVEKALFSLKPGETSPIIATEISFIIARVEDKTEFKPAFDTPEIQEEIRRLLSNQKFITGARTIKDKLLKEASIYVDPEFIKKP